ncbi:hypothetical protein OUZ56_003700 [Daphnia magna]|uniref:Uncharacterized protein n=1 Tax=Daphnia magna TaxID=35525 RepID=A0ABR0A9I0_9CRUS|nr:hypothetical protein OUZ56_003700 [Daphnia magna]
MAELIDKLRNLVTSMRVSPKRIPKSKKILMDLNLSNSKLQYEEEEVLLSTLNRVVITGDLLPILDVQTRWSSTY